MPFYRKNWSIYGFWYPPRILEPIPGEYQGRLDLAQSLFPHLWNGEKQLPTERLCWGITEATDIKDSGQCLALKNSSATVVFLSQLLGRGYLRAAPEYEQVLSLHPCEYFEFWAMWLYQLFKYRRDEKKYIQIKSKIIKFHVDVRQNQHNIEKQLSFS